MKNPNGFGSVYKLSDKKRRKPWAVRVTVSWDIVDGKLKRKYKYIGYYETRKEAMQALSEYNVNPATVTKDILFVDLYKMWSDEKYQNFSQSTITSYSSAFKACKPIYGCKFTDLRRPQLQKLIDVSGKAYPTLKNIKTLISHLYSFAIENDICNKDYSQFIDLTKYSKQNKENKKEIHAIFTETEINNLWKISETNESAVFTLILIYTGLRISELLQPLSTT